jgi:DNA polymerase III alpha subunit
LIRSGYAFRTAYGPIDQVISRLVETGFTTAPITDRLSTFAFVRWTKAAKASGLKPIYGVELPVVTELGQAKPIVDNWRFMAKDNLRPLHDAIYTATNNPGREPSLTYRQALAMPGLIKIAGERLLVDAVAPALEGLEAASEDFYVALSPATSKGLYRRALRSGLKLFATTDNYYPREDDLETYRVALGRRSGTQTYPRHIMADGELRSWFAEFGFDADDVRGAFENRDAAFARCSASLKLATLLIPEKPQTLLEMCQAGATRLGVDLADPVYQARVEKELSLIEEKEFESYFRLIEELVTWAKKHMVVGPARGSSCGSLVCYLLGITAIDPLKYDLIFERFIDINRGGYFFHDSFVKGLEELF